MTFNSKTNYTHVDFQAKIERYNILQELNSLLLSTVSEPW